MSIHARGTDPHEPLDAVLRAATAPGHLAELAGEEQAVAAFRAAVPVPRRRSLFARVLTVKVLVVGAVATSTGVVLATAGGVLPMWPEPPAVETPVTPATTNPAEVAPPAGMDETAPPETPVTTSTTGGPPTPDGSPDQDHQGPGKGDKGDKDGRDRDRPGGFGSSSTPPTTEEHSKEESQTSGPPSSRAETPDSPAHGAVTAVPPNGAVPPTSGD